MQQLADNVCFSRFNTPKHLAAKNLISKFLPREAEWKLSWCFRFSPELLIRLTMRAVLLQIHRLCCLWPSETWRHPHLGAHRAVKESSKTIKLFPFLPSLATPPSTRSHPHKCSYLQGGRVISYWLSRCAPSLPQRLMTMVRVSVEHSYLVLPTITKQSTEVQENWRWAVLQSLIVEDFPCGTSVLFFLR